MQWFKNLRLHRKVRVSFITLSFLLVAIFAVAFWNNTEKMAVAQIDSTLMSAVKTVEFTLDPKVHENPESSESAKALAASQSLKLTQLAKDLDLP